MRHDRCTFCSVPRRYYVYILASRPHGTLYVGVTSDLIRRVHEHRIHADPDAFTAAYGVTRLVHYEAFDDPANAILRGKRIKKWRRAWEVRLIEQGNPRWDDLFSGLVE